MLLPLQKILNCFAGVVTGEMFRNMQNSEIIRKMTEEFDEVIFTLQPWTWLLSKTCFLTHYILRFMNYFVPTLTIESWCYCRTAAITRSQWPGRSGRSSSLVSASLSACWCGSVSTASSMTNTWWTRSSRCSLASQTLKSALSDTPAHWQVSISATQSEPFVMIGPN